MVAPSPSPVRLLVVQSHDDFVMLQDELVASLPAEGLMLAAQAGTLAQGIEQARAGVADLVLLDLALPDGRGLEAFSRFHAAMPSLPVVVYAAGVTEELALQVLQAGAHECLTRNTLSLRSVCRTLRHCMERAKVEHALAQERDLLQTLLENIPDRIYFKDTESRFTRINRALTDLFHLTCPEEVHGKTDADFYGSKHAQEALADERRVMVTGRPITNKVEFEEMTDGCRSWSLTTKLPLRDREGRVIGTCGISREVTELKEMEQQLATERNLLRSVIDNVPDLIFLKDVAGRYLLSNAAHLRWLGLEDPLAVIGRSTHEFFPDEVAQRLEQEDQQVLQSGVAMINREERLTDRSGRVRWVLGTKVPWRGQGTEVIGMVCIARDITQQKEAEENLRRAYEELARSQQEERLAMAKLRTAHQELREVQMQLIEAEKLKSIGRLAAGVAHEVKNPLGILQMGVDFLHTVPFEDETAHVILKEMREAVGRADTVIRELLEFSAPRKMECYPADLNKIIDGALKMVRGEMKGSYTVERELDESMPEICVDAAKISQIFINVFTNALHAMNGRGTLRVRTYSRLLTGVGENVGSCETECFRFGQRLVVAEVDDSGDGIPADKLAKVFDPFFTTKPTGKGTGLGLSVVKTIVDLHGGTIELRNRPEGGVRVTIVLPAKVQEGSSVAGTSLWPKRQEHGAMAVSCP